MLRSLLSLALTAALCVSSASGFAAGEEGVVVEINKSSVVNLPDAATVVAIADPGVADVEMILPEVVSVRGISVGQTSLVAYNQAGEEIFNDTVTVTHNLSALNRIIKATMPDSNINFNSMDGALVMTGKVDSPMQAENVRRMATPFLGGQDTLINMLTVEGSDQVMLQVKVAEVSRTELKRFGINLGAIIGAGGDFAFGMVTGRNIGTSTVDAITRNADDNSIQLSHSTGNVDLNGVIDALAEDNLIKVLAEPNLTTASGRTASFLAGGEIPIPVPGQDGTVTIDWREYGVSLRFTPQVISAEKISLNVAPEVSELSQIGAIELQGFNIPSLTTRRAETTVELGSGQSFAIAGLLQHDHSNDVSKFPGLGDVPILGALFRSSEFRNEQTELVIIVTPYIVRGAPAKDLMTPVDGMKAPNDAERLLLERSYHPYTNEKALPPQNTNKPRLSPHNRRNSKSEPLARQADALPLQADSAPRQVMPSAQDTILVPAPVPPPTPVMDVPKTAATSPKPTAPAATLRGPVGYRLQ